MEKTIMRKIGKIREDYKREDEEKMSYNHMVFLVMG